MARPQGHRYIGWLLGQQLVLLQASVCSAEEWVSDGGFAPGFSVEQEKVLQPSLSLFVGRGLKSVECCLDACGPQHRYPLACRAGGHT